MKLRIAGIVKDSIVDGPGLRLAIFAQGCSHHCEGCHNPDTWNYEGGQLIDLDEILEEVKQQKLISGITISGGEPFDQASGFKVLAEEAKKLGLSVVTYTGYTFEEILQAKEEKPDWYGLLQSIDLLIDGAFDNSLKDLGLPYRGSKNQRIIKVADTLAANEIILL